MERPGDDARPDREVAAVLVGLMVGLFASVSSSMIVANALLAITLDLDATPDGGIWIVLASLMTMTVATPVWGKLADHLDKKRLTQAAIVIFIVASIGAGLAPGVEALVAMRALQGVATGGLMAMSQAVLGAITTPRRRGAYSGYLGAVMSVATLLGPLIGGVVVDAPGLGWRWCFFLLVPLALVSLIVVQATLHVPRGEGRPRIDLAGTTLLAVAVTLLVSWITFGGVRFPWVSLESAALVAGTVLAVAALIVVERRVAEPILVGSLLRTRTVAWAALGSTAMGVVMFSSILFLSQYLQLAREHSASVAGALAAPMLTATLVGSIAGGHLVARTGRLTTILVVGSAVLLSGFVALATLTAVTPDALVVLATLPVGLGIGLVMQNFVLAAQNAVDVTWVGRASSLLSLCRSLAGAVGVAALGSVAVSVAGPDPDPVEFADATAVVYAISAVAAALGLLSAAMLGRQTLRSTVRA
jgi:MFS family permease